MEKKKPLKLQERFFILMASLINKPCRIEKNGKLSGTMYFADGKIIGFDFVTPEVLDIWIQQGDKQICHIGGNIPNREAYSVKLFDGEDGIEYDTDDLTRTNKKSANLFFSALCGFWREVNND